MMLYSPDSWMLLEITNDEGTRYKVFGVWAGGYVNGDNWRLNSGVVSVDEDDTHYSFYGASGSVYKCRKGSHRLTAYCSCVVSQMIETGYAKVVEEDNIESVLVASGLLDVGDN
jgi:hypothetical protein